MFEALGVSFIYLTGGGIAENPVHTYQYEYTSEYGVRDIADGTHFYIRNRPTVDVDFVAGVGSDILLTVNVSSGTDTPKLKSTPSMSINVQKIIQTSDSARLTLSLDLALSGYKENIPCVDGQGTVFHCYHGVVPTDPYYLLSFEAIDAIYNSNKSVFKGIGISYEIAF
jgi:hypothetical protein